jgi:hypothetical protein
MLKASSSLSVDWRPLAQAQARAAAQVVQIGGPDSPLCPRCGGGGGLEPTRPQTSWRCAVGQEERGLPKCRFCAVDTCTFQHALPGASSTRWADPRWRCGWVPPRGSSRPGGTLPIPTWRAAPLGVHWDDAPVHTAHPRAPSALTTPFREMESGYATKPPTGAAGAK